MTIETLLDGCNSIIELERKLKKTYFSKAKYPLLYLEKFESDWRNDKREITQKIIETDFKERNDLPTKEITVDDVTYKLHGICHGGNKAATPGWAMKRNLRKKIESIILKYGESPDQDYFYEEGFNRLFKLDKSNQIKDRTALQNTDKTKMKLKKKEYLTLILVSPFIPVILPAYYLYRMYDSLKMALDVKTKKEGWSSDPHTSKIGFLSMDSLSELSAQHKLFEFLKTNNLPEPFNLEMEYIREKIEAIKESKVLEKVKYDVRFKVTERSLYTARELVKKAKSEKIKCLHYVGGMMHISAIEYFLKNPAYSFEKIDNYMENNIFNDVYHKISLM